jgi:hypothetical protein
VSEHARAGPVVCCQLVEHRCMGLADSLVEFGLVEFLLPMTGA